MGSTGGHPGTERFRDALRRILGRALARRIGVDDGAHYFQCQYCLSSRQTLPEMESDHEAECPYVIARDALGESWQPEVPLCARGHWQDSVVTAADCADCRRLGVGSGPDDPTV